jgi:hypothetical protein
VRRLRRPRDQPVGVADSDDVLPPIAVSTDGHLEGSVRPGSGSGFQVGGAHVYLQSHHWMCGWGLRARSGCTQTDLLCGAVYLGLTSLQMDVEDATRWQGAPEGGCLCRR